MAGIQQTGAQDTVAFDGFKQVDKTGNIAKSDDYRDRYQMLGAYTVIDPNGNQQIGILQPQNNTLVLTYSFQHAGPPPYQNTFQVQLQPLP